MKRLIKVMYNIFLPLSLALPLFSILLILFYCYIIIQKWDYVYKKIPVRVETYGRDSMGDGGYVDYSVGFNNTKEVKIEGILSLDSTYIVWHNDEDDYSYLVKSKEETFRQFKYNRLLYRTKFLAIVFLINIFVIGSVRYLIVLKKKYNISNDEDEATL